MDQFQDESHGGAPTAQELYEGAVLLRRDGLDYWEQLLLAAQSGVWIQRVDYPERLVPLAQWTLAVSQMERPAVELGLRPIEVSYGLTYGRVLLAIYDSLCTGSKEHLAQLQL